MPRKRSGNNNSVPEFPIDHTGSTGIKPLRRCVTCRKIKLIKGFPENQECDDCRLKRTRKTEMRKIFSGTKHDLCKHMRIIQRGEHATAISTIIFNGKNNKNINQLRLCYQCGEPVFNELLDVVAHLRNPRRLDLKATESA